MATDPTHQHADHTRPPARQPTPDTGTQPAESLSLTPAESAGLLTDARLDGRGNEPMRVALTRQVQRTYGNRALQRRLAGQPPAPWGARAVQRWEAAQQERADLLPDATPAANTAAEVASPAEGPAVQRVTGPIPVQREAYLDLRGVGDDYTGLNDEQTVQRPGLIGAIMAVVTQLQQASQAYEAVRMTAPFPVLMPLVKKRDMLHRFLRKQDVDVTPQGVLTPGSLAARLVEYDAPGAQQDSTLVNIVGGQLQRNNALHTPVDTTESVTFQTGEGWEIFVMDPEGVLHMTSHKIGKRHHSSMLAGGATSAAGSIKAVGGTITNLNNKSGHYTPGPAQMRQALHKLEKSGVALNFQLLIQGPGAFNGLASDYMKSTATGGQGARDTFEFETTNRILHHFIGTHGAPAVSTTFTALGWTYTSTLGGITILKDTGATPTHEEVRNILRARFASAGPVTVTHS